MDINSRPKIELSLEIEGNSYSFCMPIGKPIKEGQQALSFFHSGLDKLLKESEEEKKSEEAVEEIVEDSQDELLDSE